MRILGIDPGPEASAWCLFDGERVCGAGILGNETILTGFESRMFECNGEVSVLGLEMIASYGMPVGAEIFETCVWIGRFIQAWGSRSSITRIKRIEVKSHICHSSKATDANIRQALIDRFGPPTRQEIVSPVGKSGKLLKERMKTVPGPTAGLSKDMWAALAVAATVWDQHGSVEK